MSWQRISVLLTALVLLPTQVFAQQGPRDRPARSLISTALEDYQNLEIDRSLERLQAAMRTCANNGCSNAVTAKVYMAMGIVQVGGQQNNAAGIESMVHALQLDANAEPDAMLVTPEISQAFRQAQGQVAGGARPTTNPNPTTNPTPRPVNTPSHGSGDLLHTPAPEQLANTPLPVYVEPSGTLSVEHVYVYYKGNGMRSFERREMNHVANGYGAEIPCASMIAPSMEYYVTAVDANTQIVATVGSESSPVQVPIVGRRTQPASMLPGRPPPETCASDTEECPPGMTGPRCRSHTPHGNRGLGDPCAANDECGDGLHCDAGACAVGDAASTEPTEPTDPNAPRTARFSIDAAFGVGAAFLTGRPSYAEQRYFTSPTMGTVRSCSGYTCYATIDPGFAPTYFINLNIRYNVTSRIGLAVVGRLQIIDSADWTIEPTAQERMMGGSARSNPFANLLLMARLYYAFTPHGFAAQGFVASAFAGGGVGQIEPKPAIPDNVMSANGGAHVLSGYGNAHAGVRVEYGLRNGFHVGGEVALQFMFPTFLFNMDFSGFIGFHL